MDSDINVLIIDDDAEVRRVLEQILTRYGYTCHLETNGRDGLDVLEVADFDVLLLDLIMPEMGGIEVLSAMANESCETVPVILSGHGEIENVVEAMRHGAFDFLEKPVKPDQLKGAIDRAALHRRACGQAREMTRLAEQWEATFDASQDMIVVLDANNGILRCNEAVARKLRLDKSEVLGLPCHQTLCGGDHDESDCPFCCFEGLETRTREFQSRHWGGYFEIVSVPLARSCGKVWGAVHTVRDITERKHSEEERALLATAMGQVADAIMITDTEGVIQYVNPAFEQMTGYSRDTIFGKTPAILKSGKHEATFYRDLWRTLQRNEVWTGHFINRRKDGSFYETEATISPVRGQDGQLMSYVAVKRDLSKIQELEAQLRQSQKLESIGQLAAGIAHEINTPIQYVGDNARFLEDSFSDLTGLLERVQKHLENGHSTEAADAEHGELRDAFEEADYPYLREEIPTAIEQSLEGVNRVASIVRAMKDFSHPGGEDKIATDINKAIESTVTVSRNEWKYVADLETDLDPDLPLVPCHPADFNQVILNLIVNAAHAITDVAGQDGKQRGRIGIRTSHRADWVEIRVSDTGAGIPEAIQQRIFDPFFTTKEAGKGTGQGLAISYNIIVMKHSGKISFETEAGKGTTFLVQLPLLVEEEGS